MNPFRDPETGEIVLGQAPNASILAFVGSSVVAWLSPDGRVGEAARGTAGIAITWWALDELFRGVTPFRRLTGFATLGLLLARILR